MGEYSSLPPLLLNNEESLWAVWSCKKIQYIVSFLDTLVIKIKVRTSYPQISKLDSWLLKWLHGGNYFQSHARLIICTEAPFKINNKVVYRERKLTSFWLIWPVWFDRSDLTVVNSTLTPISIPFTLGDTAKPAATIGKPHYLNTCYNQIFLQDT